MTKSPKDLETFEVRYENVPVREILPPPGSDESITQMEASTPPVLLLPPVVNEIGDSEYRIVDGLSRFHRISAKQEETVWCGIITPKASPSGEAYLRLLLNPGRNWNVREKIAILHTILSSENSVDREMLSKRGISPADVKAIQYLQSCPQDVFEAVVSEQIHLGVVREFCVLSIQDRTAFLDAVTGLSTSLQMQREILEWSAEIASARNISVAALYDSPEIRSILSDPAQNAPQHIRRLRGTLFALRFPRFDAARQDWDKHARSVSKIGGITLNPDSAFEKNRLEVKIVLKRPDRAGEVFRKLSDIPEGTWEMLISPFAGALKAPENQS